MIERRDKRRGAHLELVADPEKDNRGVGRFRSDQSDALQPGDRVAGRYHVMRKCAEGGMAEIYEVYDLETNGLLALKTLQLKHRNNRALARRADEEARTLLRMRHAHLVTVTDAGVDGHLVFFVMELLKGCDLRTLLVHNNKPLPIRVALDLLFQLAAGVHALHDAGVIHRDLKPENVFVQRVAGGRLQVKLLDLGAAKFEHRKDVTTSIGTTPGTAQYMSPEQSGGETKLGPPSDVYSLGLILIELILGTHLAKLEVRQPLTVGDWTEWQMSYPKPPLGPLLSDAHPDVVMLLTACIERLSKRVPDAATLADAIAGLLAKLGTQRLEEEYAAIELPELTDLGRPRGPAIGVDDRVRVAVDSKVTPRTPFARTEERPRAKVDVPPDERDTIRMASARAFDSVIHPPSPPPARATPSAPVAHVKRAEGPATPPAPEVTSKPARGDELLCAPRRARKKRRGPSLKVALAMASLLSLPLAFAGAYYGSRPTPHPAPSAVAAESPPAPAMPTEAAAPPSISPTASLTAVAQPEPAAPPSARTPSGTPAAPTSVVAPSSASSPSSHRAQSASSAAPRPAPPAARPAAPAAVDPWLQREF